MIRKHLIASLAALLFLGGAAQAQRRVITAPGQKAPDQLGKPDEKKPEPEPEPEVKKEEPKKKVPVKSEEKPVEAEKPPEPEKPLGPVIPKDERGASSSAAKKPDKTVVVAETQEVVYRKKVNKTIVTLHVRPAKPVPGKLTTFLFEIVKLLEVPDPALGDRAPEENAHLVATLKGGSHESRIRLHGLKDAGTYGMHFTAPEAGSYKIQVDQRLDNPEIGDVALSVEFVVGIGVATQMPVADEEDAQKARKGRSALKVIGNAKAGPGEKAEGPTEVMKELGRRWLDLQLALEEPKPTAGDLAAQAKAIAELVPKADGQVPMSMAINGKEFNLFVGQLADAVNELPALTADKGKAKAFMAKTETEMCLRCHAKYRFQITDDVSHWPKFEPKDPSEKKAHR